mgnify:CR=1 FL=1
MPPKKTRRQEVVDLLRDHEWSFDDLRHHLGLTVKVLEEDLKHIARSVRAAGERMLVSPASCSDCGFEFTKPAMHPPGRCPKCRERRIDGPWFHIPPRNSGAG